LHTRRHPGTKVQIVPGCDLKGSTSMTMLQCPVQFGGYTGTAYRHDHKWWVPVRPLSDFLGLNFRSQQRRIQDDEAMTCVVIMTTQPRQRQARPTLMLDTSDIGFWLRSISPAKVAETARPMLINMQKRLADAVREQVNEAFGIPSQADLEALINAPWPFDDSRAAIIALRTSMLAEPGVASAAQLFKMGLPGTKTGTMLGRSSYWACKQRRRLESVGMLPPRKLPPVPAIDWAQIDLFGGAGA
jgi:hypothetical protein